MLTVPRGNALKLPNNVIGVFMGSIYCSIKDNYFIIPYICKYRVICNGATRLAKTAQFNLVMNGVLADS